MGQVLFHCLPLISCCSLNRRPHGRKFSVTNDRRDLELNPKPFDPRAQVSPHLADVAGHGDGNTTTADRLTNSVLQFKAVKTISRRSGIDVLSKPRAGLPSPIHGGERPNNQIVLHQDRSNKGLLARPEPLGNWASSPYQDDNSIGASNSDSH